MVSGTSERKQYIATEWTPHSVCACLPPLLIRVQSDADGEGVLATDARDVTTPPLLKSFFILPPSFSEGINRAPL